MKDFSEIENMFDHEKGSSKKLSEVRNQLNNLVSEFAEAIVEMTIKHTAQVSALQAENEALRQRVAKLEGANRLPYLWNTVVDEDNCNHARVGQDKLAACGATVHPATFEGDAYTFNYCEDCTLVVGTNPEIEKEHTTD